MYQSRLILGFSPIATGRSQLHIAVVLLPTLGLGEYHPAVPAT
ncbi:MAG: hypothetical protein WBA43_20360 [Elainellaceae cyanobacterium]|jgi:hypothetical protein